MIDSGYDKVVMLVIPVYGLLLLLCGTGRAVLPHGDVHGGEALVRQGHQGVPGWPYALGGASRLRRGTWPSHMMRIGIIEFFIF